MLSRATRVTSIKEERRAPLRQGTVTDKILGQIKILAEFYPIKWKRILLTQLDLKVEVFLDSHR